MSYSRFLDDLNDFFKQWRESGNTDKASLETAQNAVRDNWLIAGRYRELISFILENWDSGNCYEFMWPLTQVLLEKRDSSSFKRLWRGVLRNRLDKTWYYYALSKEQFPELRVEDYSKVDLSNFNQFSSTEDIRRRAAFEREYTLRGISEFISCLELLGETAEIDRAKILYQSVYSMEKPAPKPSTDKRKIDEILFWELIEHSRQDASDQFDFLERLRSVLETFKPVELRRFQKFLIIKQGELYSWEHWALAYIVRRGCGDDEFDYFRVWAVSKGRKDFEAIKNLEISKLERIFDEDPQLESFLYLSDAIYQDKTGEIMKDIRVKHSKLKGKEWSEEKIRADFPTLSRLFSY